MTLQIAKTYQNVNLLIQKEICYDMNQNIKNTQYTN